MKYPPSKGKIMTWMEQRNYERFVIFEKPCSSEKSIMANKKYYRKILAILIGKTESMAKKHK